MAALLSAAHGFQGHKASSLEKEGDMGNLYSLLKGTGPEMAHITSQSEVVTDTTHQAM